MKTKIYDLVKQLLTDHTETRDSDKYLIWAVYNKLGYLRGYQGVMSIQFDQFLLGPSFESIRRCRQKIQEKHPELQSSKWIRKQREAMEKQKGTWIYREVVSEQGNLL